MSPMHLTVWASALSFQIANGACIGGWLGGYGPTSNTDWEAHTPRVLLGLAIFVLGFAGNIYHDDELRSLRRTAARESQEIQQQTQEKKGMGERERDGKGERQAGSAQKVYKVPQAGLFRYILYPHYFCEWVEWIGYWIIGGWACAPARNFVANEVAAMMPQAVDGKRWYVSRFGREVEGRRAILPGVL
ncbi:MAG: hypothetical protein LQ340_007068 [Diploschistes diacapsis]|nr:MAG: hypothetical protein LQ340_007068 [Diploschistes diacapsis]